MFVKLGNVCVITAAMDTHGVLWNKQDWVDFWKKTLTQEVRLNGESYHWFTVRQRQN
jgi:hypothetical protein